MESSELLEAPTKRSTRKMTRRGEVKARKRGLQAIHIVLAKHRKAEHDNDNGKKQLKKITNERHKQTRRLGHQFGFETPLEVVKRQ
jgi:hypothetical protein